MMRRIINKVKLNKLNKNRNCYNVLNVYNNNNNNNYNIYRLYSSQLTEMNDIDDDFNRNNIIPVDDELFMEHMEEKLMMGKSNKTKSGEVSKLAIDENEEYLVEEQDYINERLRQHLLNNDIETLFPVQAKAFAPVFEGKDLLVRSQTGTGKTLAFALPLIQRLFEDPIESRVVRRKPKILVLEPTRELAFQVKEEFEKLPYPVRVVPVYGGASYNTQISQIERGAHVIVACPGRLVDLLKRGNVIDFSDLQTLVLDESDEMLKMGFQKEIDFLLDHIDHTSSYTQKLLFSATVPSWVKEISKTYAENITYLDAVVHQNQQIPVNIKHYALCGVPDRDSQATLINDIIEHYAPGGSVMLFCKTKSECDFYASHSALAALSSGNPLHGDIAQNQRQQLANQFKNKQVKLLVCTDVASRGVDFPDVQLVIQIGFDNKDQYVHRSGRTGRAGKSGINILIHDWNVRRDVITLSRSIAKEILHISPPNRAIDEEIIGKWIRKEINNVVMQPELEPILETLQNDYDKDELLKNMFYLFAKHRLPKKRSLLTSSGDFVTILLRPIPGVNFRLNQQVARTILEFAFPKHKLTYGQHVQFNDDDGLGLLMEIPSYMEMPLQKFLLTKSGESVKKRLTISIPTTLKSEWLEEPSYSNNRSTDYHHDNNYNRRNNNNYRRNRGFDDSEFGGFRRSQRNDVSLRPRSNNNFRVPRRRR